MNKIRVLLVDDNEEFLAATKMYLELSGDMIVETANDAEKGLLLLKIFEPDVALLDIVMPGMWGDAVAASIKTDPDLKHIAFAFFTGSKKLTTTKEVEAAGGVIGGNEFWIKGMEPATIREGILRLATPHATRDTTAS
jgi:CheY-like chemotaxis protein